MADTWINRILLISFRFVTLFLTLVLKIFNENSNSNSSLCVGVGKMWILAEKCECT